MPGLFLPDDDATAALGAALAEELQPGDVVLLEGDLGAGKTALARAIIRALAGDPALDVPSPTFALVQPYDTPKAPVLHADLYRLGDPREVDELGLSDNPAAIVLVEWAERSPEITDAATLVVSLAIPPGGDGRSATLTHR
ncbi:MULTISPECIES: tRNA (adenosine(37)-N6)-threonylcarbamoyltransferase complex ATPase subunit type 1 TsaE [Devosia]|jgi:tRNA threonylcarbamoyladenosine biosynthesis protein TsaE|uniref:tRNA threonylcarbamoyladenosine biosynthesis protein TsaE n=1 Tax=Devosia litorisediminis TaxID=2829817 RepID=A0A942EGV6_9HYPH|nr:MULTISPECIES: tRNA (adenosine(37)-N6)-threonylcarbamoyltransferase complex ATPase subunit type 1 TsaE [Devosia]MBS3849691.1 tRNA (adenosine(37)-N6)-threonylcarbamoyltransferase complex ATPase subunit type 1 TsaE [Devosia litorisediminis]MCZ4347973.1 tRNA (adenosine(37)-N6)-threonylcarbamoyltransferase complex ATPase subunit type 1 TsaE [Devosia neptuniae]|tara:strand:+ start:71651 stop:72073 length:423 start_codon:yes stop_codon:yes gene_type:complete